MYVRNACAVRDSEPCPNRGLFTRSRHLGPAFVGRRRHRAQFVATGCSFGPIPPRTSSVNYSALKNCYYGCQVSQDSPLNLDPIWRGQGLGLVCDTQPHSAEVMHPKYCTASIIHLKGVPTTIKFYQNIVYPCGPHTYKTHLHRWQHG